MKKRILLISSFCLLLLSSCNTSDSSMVENEQKPAETATNKLMGSWEMKETHWKTADTTYSIDKAQEGLLMINEHRYSIMWTPTAEPRQAFQVLSDPTDEELKSGFRSIVFNAGSYEMTDSTMTTTAYIAKVPGFEGGKQYYRYEIEGNRLSLTMFDETYPNGDKPEWFGRYVTEFVMEKVD